MPQTDPFAILSFIAGPALLTNASTVLLLGTINRYGRALDRARGLASRAAGGNVAETHRQLLLEQLNAANRRVLVILRSLSLFYVSVGSFALATLSFLLGDVVLAALGIAQFTLWVMVGLATLGTFALVCGACLMGWESHISYRVLRREGEFARAQAEQFATRIAEPPAE